MNEKNDGGVAIDSTSLLADALDAIRALMIELENYTMVHGADDDDRHALSLGRDVMRKANATRHVSARSDDNVDVIVGNSGGGK